MPKAEFSFMSNCRRAVEERELQNLHKNCSKIGAENIHSYANLILSNASSESAQQTAKSPQMSRAISKINNKHPSDYFERNLDAFCIKFTLENFRSQ